MNKLFKILLLSLLLPLTALAQNQGEPLGLGQGGTRGLCRVNATGAATADDGDGNYLACDESGRILTSSSSGASVPTEAALVVADAAEAASTSTVIVATSHVARVGDAVYFTAGTAANIGKYSYVTAVATNSITVSPALPSAPAATDAFNIVRPRPVVTALEDEPLVSGEKGYLLLGVRSGSNTIHTSTDLDKSPISVAPSGAILSSPYYEQSMTQAQQGMVLEDAAPSTGAALHKNSVVAQDPLTQDVAATNRWGWPKTDLVGRTVVTGAPASQIVVGCNTAVTTATTGSVIAAVASNYTFVTALNCTNTGAAATRVILEDGDGTDLANVLLAATTGFAALNFPTPVRTNAVNKAIQINVITTSSSTICCASGFTGVN